MARQKATVKPAEENAKVEADGRMASLVWTGSLQIAAINIPVRMFTAAREERIGFNQLHGGSNGCGGRLKMGPMHCPKCEVDVTRDEIVKGYESARDRYIQLTPEEIEQQKPESSSLMELDSFVPTEQLNPLWFQSAYYLAADEAIKNKTYSVLRQGLIDCKVAAVGKVCVRSSENVVFVLPHPDGGLVAYTAYLADEIRQIKFQNPAEITSAEREAARKFITAATADLDMSQYQDEYRANLLRLIAAKQEGKQLAVVPAKPKAAQSDNLLQMLEASAIAVKQRKAKKAS